MPADFIKFAMIAGEVAPAFHGRSDLEKFDLALAEAKNWFVDYRGPLSTRMGTQFIDFLEDEDGKPTRMFAFSFAPDTANTYGVIVGDGYIRFIQDGGYVLETAKTVSAATVAAIPTFTSAAHGFNNGDPVKFTHLVWVDGHLDYLYRIKNKATNTFQIETIFGEDVPTTAFGAFTSASVSRVYSVASPWAAADLDDLQGKQVKDTLRFTHPSYPTKDLVRTNHTNWSISDTNFASRPNPPSGLTLQASQNDYWSVGFAVTAVNKDGEESLASDMAFCTNTVNYTGVQYGSIIAKWNPEVGAEYYKVYRTRLVDTSVAISRSFQLGYIGRTSGAHFIDTNITPDFATSPPIGFNPFANQAIESIDVTAGGAGYDNTSLITIGGPGSNFRGALVIGTDNTTGTGPILGVIIFNRGVNYSAPVVNITGSGAGAMFNVTTTPADGNYPRTTVVHQQRQVYGGTDNDPLTIDGSRPGRLSNFDGSNIVLQNDGYEHDIDSADVAPIRHLVSVQGGMIVFTQTGMWLVSGAQGASITPTNVQADPQAATGATKVDPIKIDINLLYCEGKGGSVRLLEYNYTNRVYGGLNMSILANHLITPDKQIVRWAYAEEPHKIVLAVRSDGVVLCFTIMKEQQVYAWTRWATQGFVTDVIVLREANVDVVYFTVQRFIGGRYEKYIERLHPRDFGSVEEAWCVDAGLSLLPVPKNATLTISGTTGTVALAATADAFLSGSVGKIVRAGGGKMLVTARSDNRHVTCEVIRPVTDVIPETNIPRVCAASTWSLGLIYDSFAGAYHLRGQTVSALIDGNVYRNVEVAADGTGVLPEPGSYVILGLPFECLAKALPPSMPSVVLDGRRKRTVGVTSRVLESRGLEIGDDLERMYQVKERTNEAIGEPTDLQTGARVLQIDPRWALNNFTYFRVTDPTPATLLGYVLDFEVGDDKD